MLPHQGLRFRIQEQRRRVMLRMLSDQLLGMKRHEYERGRVCYFTINICRESQYLASTSSELTSCVSYLSPARSVDYLRHGTFGRCSRIRRDRRS
jgi:hypothetical protein